MSPGEWISGKCFQFVHSRNLIYNACWEDPRLDRQALELGPDDVVLVITSAGCNALDYALDAPRRVHAVDMNPRQNALLELKIAGIRALDHETFFEMFGRGRVEDKSVYRRALRPELSPAARDYWDRHVDYFDGSGWRDSFYFHGTSGLFARLVNSYIDRVAKVRDEVDAILSADSVDAQRSIYHGGLADQFWRRFLRWVAGRDTTLSLLGVPRAQRHQVERHYPGGISKFIEDAIEAVFCMLPIHDNYFWRVYLTGQYSPSCCPEYLRPENFERLKAGLVDRIQIHTGTILDVLDRQEEPISRYVLLDHMDWLSGRKKDVLAAEWNQIVGHAAEKTRVLWRSGGLHVDFVDPIEVCLRNQRVKVGELLRYDTQLAAELHERDRVHTYGSFYIADLALA